MEEFNYQKTFLDYILITIVVVFPVDGPPVTFLFLTSTVFIGRRGEKMIGIQKMPSALLMGK